MGNVGALAIFDPRQKRDSLKKESNEHQNNIPDIKIFRFSHFANSRGNFQKNVKHVIFYLFWPKLKELSAMQLVL